MNLLEARLALALAPIVSQPVLPELGELLERAALHAQLFMPEGVMSRVGLNTTAHDVASRSRTSDASI